MHGWHCLTLGYLGWETFSGCSDFLCLLFCGWRLGSLDHGTCTTVTWSRQERAQGIQWIRHFHCLPGRFCKNAVWMSETVILLRRICRGGCWGFHETLSWGQPNSWMDLDGLLMFISMEKQGTSKNQMVDSGCPMVPIILGNLSPRNGVNLWFLLGAPAPWTVAGESEWPCSDSVLLWICGARRHGTSAEGWTPQQFVQPRYGTNQYEFGSKLATKKLSWFQEDNFLGHWCPWPISEPYQYLFVANRKFVLATAAVGVQTSTTQHSNQNDCPCLNFPSKETLKRLLRCHVAILRQTTTIHDTHTSKPNFRLFVMLGVAPMFFGIFDWFWFL